jgi:hypothetical protein
MSSPQAKIWTRRFTRQAGPDADAPMDAAAMGQITDSFGKYLLQSDKSHLMTFDDHVSYFWEQSQKSPQTCSVATFVVADGAHVDRAKIPGDDKSWFDAHVRLITTVVPATERGTMFFIVGSDEVKNPARFLQAMSWDGKAFHYYAVEKINDGDRGWTYQGSSADAFTDGDNYNAAYLGPFNGHVNGACIMKELHRPWMHWHVGARHISDCMTQTQIEFLKTIPYLSRDNGLFQGASVKPADSLEGVIGPLVTTWSDNRAKKDFTYHDDAGRIRPLELPQNVHRWMAHLLLTTTVNFASANFNTNDDTKWNAPQDHFFNSELLANADYSSLVPDTTPSFSYSLEHYHDIIKDLRISLLQEAHGPVPVPGVPSVKLAPGTLGGGKQTDSHDVTDFLEVATDTEGIDIQFVTLQSSLEDAAGVMSMQSPSNRFFLFSAAAADQDDGGPIASVAAFPLNGGDDDNPSPKRLISEKAVRTILALDFCNPVYSWRRGVLMQYLPAETKLKASKTDYDLEENFVAAIRESSYAGQEDSPENGFLKIYDAGADKGTINESISNYMDVVNERIGTRDGLKDYLMLAESRRRLYRPLPLNENGVQLPYAIALPTDWKPIEMMEDGTVQDIPERGLQFLRCWTGSLHGYDPHVLPQQGCFPKPAARRCPRA